MSIPTCLFYDDCISGAHSKEAGKMFSDRQRIDLLESHVLVNPAKSDFTPSHNTDSGAKVAEGSSSGSSQSSGFSDKCFFSFSTRKSVYDQVSPSSRKSSGGKAIQMESRVRCSRNRSR